VLSRSIDVIYALLVDTTNLCVFCVCVLCIFYVYMGQVPEIKHDDDDDDDDTNMQIVGTEYVCVR